MTEDRGGMEDIPGEWCDQPCFHLEHEPPKHLCIPPGKQYRHICPRCKKLTVLRAPQVTF